MTPTSNDKVSLISRRSVMWVSVVAYVQGVIGIATANASSATPESDQLRSGSKAPAGPGFSFPGPSNVWHYLANSA